MQIFTIIVGIIIILLLVGITVCVTIEEETFITIKYGFLKFKINLDENEEEIQSFKHEVKEKFKKIGKEVKDRFLKFINYTPKEKNESAKTKTKTRTRTQKKKKSFKKIMEKLKEALSYVKPIFNVIKMSIPDLIKCFKFRKVKVKMFVASEDAHQTAIQFAKTSTTISNLVSLLRIYTDIEIKKIEINADFLSEKSVNNIYFEVKFRLLFVIGNIVRLLFRIIVALALVSNENQRKQNKV